MVLTTDVYYDIDGVPLQTLAYNITTWGGDLPAPPPLRGADITIPYMPGQLFQPRVPDGRTITFSMWVQGSDVDGKVPTSDSAIAQFRNNLKTLRALFWKQGKQVTITKRWKDFGSNTVKSASAKAVYAGGFAPAMTGAARATFAVEMWLSDPFFYGPEVTVNFTPASATINQTITVEGDYETTAITLDVLGARNNFRLTNTTEAIYMNNSQNVATSHDVFIDVNAWTAVQDPAGTPVNVVGKMTQFGHVNWFALRPGSQALSLTSSSGTGTAVLKYKPRWI